MRWRRFRKWAKWACTLIGVGVAVAIPLSRWYLLSVWWDLPPVPRGDYTWRIRELDVSGGRLHVYEFTNGRGLNKPEPSHVQVGPNDRDLSWRELSWVIFEGRPSGNWYALALWPAAMPAAVLWTMSGRAALRRWKIAVSQRRLGLCRACGYDRRGLAADAACPECGAPSTPTPTRG